MYWQLLAQEVPAISEPTGWVSALLGASPPLFVCVLLVFLFLKHIRESQVTSEQKHIERQEQSMAFQKAQTDTMRQCVTDCREVIRDNTLALRQNAEAIARHLKE